MRVTARANEQFRPTKIRGLTKLPRDWEVSPVKYVCTYNDETLPETTNPEYEIAYVDIGGVSATEGITDVEEMLFGSAPSRARRVVRHGDVIVSTVRTYLEAIAWIESPPDNLIVSTGFAVIRPSSDRAEPRYLGYCLRSRRFVDEVVSRSVGVSYPAINSSDLVRIPVPLPPLSEQRAIASFLDHETARIDRLIAKQERLIELLKEKRQAVISHAVTKGLNPDAPMKDSGIEWLGEVPAHWSVGALKRIATRVVVGVAEAATHAYVDVGVPILRATNIRSGSIVGEILQLEPSYAAERVSKRIRAGDLVTVRTGNAGVTARIPPELDGAQCFTMLITTLSRQQNGTFFEYVLNSFAAKSYFTLEGWGTAQVNISVPILQNLPVAVPPEKEQEKIVQFVKEKEEALECLEKQAHRAVALLKERRAALITLAVTGAIEVGCT